jgi:23S rRNA (uracil1939-C5)-methyltransferase
MESVVTIESLSYGGKGVGSLVEKGIKYSVFVPYSVPGDTLRVNILSRNKRYLQAEIVDIITPGAGRRDAPCQYFRNCGGCQWLHIKEGVQHHEKIKILTHLLKEFSLVPEPVVDDVSLGYRSRGVFQGDVTKGRVSVGLHEERSHDIVSISRCPLMQDGINTALATFRKACASKELPEGRFTLEILQDQLDKAVFYVLNVSKRGWEMLELPNLTIMQGKKVIRQAKDKAHLLIPEETIQYKPPAFTQINPAVNRKLILHVMHYAHLTKKESVLDLYCGMGNFAFPLSQDAKKVVGIEGYLPSILTAREHAKKTLRENVEFICEDAVLGVKRLISLGKKFDVVILDPPREGMGKDIAYVPKLEPKRILYISCHPRNLSKDLRVLLKKGYALKKVIPFDMFPQTYHLEALVVLEKA